MVFGFMFHVFWGVLMGSFQEARFGYSGGEEMNKWQFFKQLMCWSDNWDCVICYCENGSGRYTCGICGIDRFTNYNLHLGSEQSQKKEAGK
jgi:hypothetical protein